MSRDPSPTTVSLLLMFLGAFTLILAFGIILGQIGAPLLLVMLWMLSFVVGAYVFSGLFANTFRFSTFHDADRRTVPFFAGIALAGGVVSGQILLLAPGNMITTGGGFLASYAGVIAGLALAGILFSATFSRVKATTFAGIVYPPGGSRFHAVSLVVLVCIAGFILLLAQLKLMALLSDSFFGMTETTFGWLVLTIAATYLVMGGMPALNVARVLGYTGLVFGIIAPMIWISFKISGNPVPQFAFGNSALQPVMEIDREMVAAGFAQKEELPNLQSAYNDTGFLAHFLAVITIAFGIASMPHLLQHFSTLKKGSTARTAAFWSIIFAAIVLSIVPVVAAFARYNLYTSVLGLQISELNFEAPWLYSLSGGDINLITVCGALVTSTADVLAACHVPMSSFIGIQDIGINPDFLLMGSAILAELPSIISVMLACGILFCVFSTMDGVLLAIANTLAADLYGKIIRPRSPPGLKLFVNRFCIIAVAIAAAMTHALVPLGASMLFSISLALGAACLFPMLLSRVWFKLFSDADLFAGMVGGTAVFVLVSLVELAGPDFAFNTGDELPVTAIGFGPEYAVLVAGFLGFIAFFVSAVGLRELKKAFFKRKNKDKANAPA